MRGMYTEFINPVYGTYKGLVAIAIGALVIAGEVHFLIIEEDGAIEDIRALDFVVDVRFDGTKWDDVSPGPEDASDE